MRWILTLLKIVHSDKGPEAKGEMEVTRCWRQNNETLKFNIFWMLIIQDHVVLVTRW